MIPIRVKAEIERWIKRRKYGRLTLVFKDGGIPTVEKNETLRSDELPPPTLIEEDEPKDAP